MEWYKWRDLLVTHKISSFSINHQSLGLVVDNFYIMKNNILLFALIIFSGCSRKEKVDGFSFPEVQPMLAVFCLLTPGDSIFANITTIRAVTDQLPTDKKGMPTYIRIPDAIVMLQNNLTQQKIVLTYKNVNGVYGAKQSNFKIAPGTSYTLYVSRPNFPSLLSTCKIPNQKAIFNSFTYGSAYNSDNVSGLRLRRVEGRWQDASTDTDSLNYFVATKYRFIPPVDTASAIHYNQYISKVGTTYFYQNDDGIDPYPQYYYLFTVSREMGRFYQMAETMVAITSSGTGDFFGAYQGIVPEYTNIQGGYGVFGGYLSSSLLVTFK